MGHHLHNGSLRQHVKFQIVNNNAAAQDIAGMFIFALVIT